MLGHWFARRSPLQSTCIAYIDSRNGLSSQENPIGAFENYEKCVLSQYKVDDAIAGALRVISSQTEIGIDRISKLVAHCEKPAIKYECYNFIGNFHLQTDPTSHLAKKAFESALEYRPNGQRAHHGLGSILNAAGEYSAAYTHLQQVDADRYIGEQKELVLGENRLNAGEPEAAQRYFEDALTHGHLSESSLHQLETVYMSLSLFSEAANILIRLCEQGNQATSIASSKGFVSATTTCMTQIMPSCSYQIAEKPAISIGLRMSLTKLTCPPKLLSFLFITLYSIDRG